MSECVLVISNLPDRASAELLAAVLLQEQAAACVNILAPCKSVYRWKGSVEEAEETPVLIKTTAACYAAAEKIIRQNHPYELPEIIAIPITGGSAPYLEWVAAQIRTES